MKKQFYRRFNYDVILTFLLIGLPFYFLLENRLVTGLILLIEVVIFSVMIAIYLVRGKVTVNNEVVSFGNKEFHYSTIKDITLLEVDYSNTIVASKVRFQALLKLRHNKCYYGVEEETLILQNYSNYRELIRSIKNFCETKQVRFYSKTNRSI